jgi:peptidoglycan/xylan/chitin deacetylase (PgdA/CDA1 family)
LTFDDGYYNNLTEALPILEKYGVPCIIFVTTGFVGGQVYPYELELAHVIDAADEIYMPDREEPYQLNGKTRRQSIYEQVRQPLKRKSHERREAFMKRFAEANGYRRSDVQTEQFLDWSDLRALSKHPLVTMGAHTHTHVLLSQQPWQQAYAEMKRSKDLLEEATGQHVECFSYPYGGNTVAVRQMARWIGFQYGFTTQPERTNQVGFVNRLAIPRIDINEFVKDDE